MAREKVNNKRTVEGVGTDIKNLGGATDLANMEKPKLPCGIEIHFLQFNLTCEFRSKRETCIFMNIWMNLQPEQS